MMSHHLHIILPQVNIEKKNTEINRKGNSQIKQSISFTHRKPTGTKYNEISKC